MGKLISANPDLAQRNPGYAYFSQLEIGGIRCFQGDPQTLDFTTQDGRVANWTIILGENGTGKTTILKCLEMMRWLLDGVQSRPRSTLQYLKAINLSKSLNSKGSVLPRELSASLTWTSKGESLTEFIKTQWHPNNSNFRHPPRDLRKEYELGLFTGYGSNRGGGLYSDTEVSRSESLFDTKSRLRSPEDWILRLDHSASRAGSKPSIARDRLEQAKRVLAGLLPDVSQIRVGESNAVYPDPKVEFLTSFGWVVFDRLSHGYQTVAAWAIDLASRMIEQYPKSRHPLAEPAIVLVDEIDMHLHPTWQRQLIDKLTAIFPNTQFIVTAHNPLIVQAAAGQDANIVLLKRVRDHVEVINDLDHIRNWRIDQIYTSDLFDLPSARPPAQDALLRRRTEILGQATLSLRDETELAEIGEKLGPIVTGESVRKLGEQLDQLIAESEQTLRKTNGKSKVSPKKRPNSTTRKPKKS